MRREVDGFEGLADNEERQQLAGRQLDDAREKAVPAPQHRLRVLEDDMALDEFDHRMITVADVCDEVRA